MFLKLWRLEGRLSPEVQSRSSYLHKPWLAGRRSHEKRNYRTWCHVWSYKYDNYCSSGNADNEIISWHFNQEVHLQSAQLIGFNGFLHFWLVIGRTSPKLNSEYLCRFVSPPRVDPLMAASPFENEPFIFLEEEIKVINVSAVAPRCALIGSWSQVTWVNPAVRAEKRFWRWMKWFHHSAVCLHLWQSKKSTFPGPWTDLRSERLVTGLTPRYSQTDHRTALSEVLSSVFTCMNENFI